MLGVMMPVGGFTAATAGGAVAADGARLRADDGGPAPAATYN